MRTKIVAGNWKMNTGSADAHVLAQGVRDGVEHIERIETILCPPMVWVSSIAQDVVHVKQFPHLKLGVQNMYFEETGAFTGETSPLMVREIAEYAIIGHSERTHIFKEKPDLIADKVQSALAHGITPILCIGEDNESTGTKQVLLDLLKKIIEDLDEEDLHRLVVAYEPVWAIGTGKAATPAYAQEVIARLREVVVNETRILYGGSVNEENAAGFLAEPDCDGFLIGGTSLKLKPFLTICQLTDDLAQKQGHHSLHQSNRSHHE